MERNPIKTIKRDNNIRDNYECFGSEQSFISSGVLPQKPQFSPSLFKNGLWLAQVPANLPSFFAQILIAIPAKATPSKTMVIISNFSLACLG